MNPEQPVITQPVIAPQPQQDIKKKSPKTLLLGLVIILLALGAGGVYYWQLQKVNDLGKTNQSLAKQLTDAKAVKPVSTTITPATVTKATTIVYKATVGKFTLALPNKYVVVQSVDGMQDGGPATSVEITSTTDADGIVKNPVGDSLKISAYNLAGNTFAQEVKGDLNDPSAKKQASIQVNGVSADVYLVSGVGTAKHIYFTKNDLFYSFKLADTTDVSSQKLADVLAGFKFN